MTDPTDPTRRPARPTRRFSALTKPVRLREADSMATAPQPEAETTARPHAEAAPRPDAAKTRRPGTIKAPRPDAVTPSTPEPAEEARIAKVMSRAGICSRRDAEGWILAGRVAVNGTLISSPALNVGPDDVISVDGAPIDKAERTRLFMFHKTRGLVTTSKDPEGRPTIFDALPEDLPRLMTVGRLDINTEGLLLLTNDGGLSRTLELPSTGWLRRYRVRARGDIDQSVLDGLAKGITIEGVEYAGIEAVLDRVQGSNVWMTMGLREGKNREIKRVLEHLGLEVNRLIRLSFGPFQLGDLDEGAVEEVKTRVLRDQLGPVLARSAGVDFEGPVTAAVVTREVRREEAATRRKPGASRAGPATGRDRAPARDEVAPRPHVSALRAARAEADEGPRRKTARSATADRKGREVAVERITTATPKRSGGRRADAERAMPNRNARRFERDRQEGEAPTVPKPRDRQTQRQADMDFSKPPRTPRPPRRDDRRSEGADEGRRPASRRDAPSGATRTFRGDQKPGRPARAGADGPPRSGAARPPRSGDARPPRARSVDEHKSGPRDDRRPASKRGAPATAGREGRGRPDGKPPRSTGGPPRQGGGGKRPGGSSGGGGGGRGRPRG